MIFNKKLFYSLWQSGALGVNKPRSWDTILEVKKSGYSGTLTVRTKGEAGGGITKYRVTIPDAEKMSLSMENCTFNESMPDEDLLIQGHVMFGTRGLEFHYSTEPIPMNVALTNYPHNSFGLSAKLLLENNVDPSSLEDIYTLLEIHSKGLNNAVVEFSCYRCSVGFINGRNTVIWEVRNY